MRYHSLVIYVNDCRHPNSIHDDFSLWIDRSLARARNSQQQQNIILFSFNLMRIQIGSVASFRINQEWDGLFTISIWYSHFVAFALHLIIKFAILKSRTAKKKLYTEKKAQHTRNRREKKHSTNKHIKHGQELYKLAKRNKLSTQQTYSMYIWKDIRNSNWCLCIYISIYQ